MQKHTIDAVFQRLLRDFGEKNIAVDVVHDLWKIEVVNLSVPFRFTSDKGGPRPGLVMARCVTKDKAEEKTTLAFFHIGPVAASGPGSLSEMFSPGGVCFNRLAQESWDLGFSTKSDVILCSFFGEYGPDRSPGMIISGPYFKFYLEVIKECADAA